jgi:hypothetical protein
VTPLNETLFLTRRHSAPSPTTICHTPTSSDSDRDDLIRRQRAALRPGEELDERSLREDEVTESSDDAINAKYDRGEIRIVTEQARYPLSTIPSLMSTENYKLDPEYQRRHRWTVQQKSRLIGSFIMNVPVPPIFLYEWDLNEYEVMDGLQRLTAVRDFYPNAFSLRGLEYWQELDGKFYRDLPKRIAAGVDRRYLSSIILLKETTHGNEDPELLKRFVFGRINTGGVQLSYQELRNALYNGPMNDLCIELAQARVFRRLWDIPENVEERVMLLSTATPDEKDLGYDPDLQDAVELENGIPKEWRDMTDVENVLRFFANRQRVITRRENLRGYLDNYLKAANKFERSVLDDLRDVFTSTIQLASNVLGEDAFKRYRGATSSGKSSVSIYDAVMNVLSRLLDHEAELISQREAVRSGLPEFYAKNSQVFNLRGQTRRNIIDRELLVEEYIQFIDQ